jgi:CubicO group peptidase (beta-lactamase class C family)
MAWLSLLVVAGAAAHALAADVPPAAARNIDRDVTSALHRFDVPGAAIMVIRGGEVSYVHAYGLQDAARSLPVRAGTLFEIGSITKQFTASAIMQLQQDGKLELDRPLSDYLPDAPHAKEVTLRQLLTHTSGLHDYLDGPSAEIEPLASRPIAYRDLVARIAPLPLDFPPGSKWSYSNTGYLLLGKVIEKLSEESYRAYLQHHFLGPLHMTHTFTSADEDRLPDMALGYRHTNGKLERAPRIHADWGSSAGFLVSNLDDLAKWDAAFHSGKIVSPASYRQMTTPFMTTSGSANYGFGLFIDSAYDQPRIGHTGGSWGFTTADEYFPKQDVRIIAFTNLGNDAPEAGETLTNVIFADLYPAIAAKTETSAPGENTAITQTTLAAFREVQIGKSYTQFGAHLKGKLAGGVGARFVAELGPYGAPTAAVFKSIRKDSKDLWYDYVMQFGPGVFLPFSIMLDASGKVAGMSIG